MEVLKPIILIKNDANIIGIRILVNRATIKGIINVFDHDFRYGKWMQNPLITKKTITAAGPQNNDV